MKSIDQANKGRHLLEIAQANGWRCENGKGDHMKIYPPSGEIIILPCYDNTVIHKGLLCKLRKQFRLAMGLAFAVLALIAGLETMGAMTW